jgi:hypothetical protein
MQLLRQSLIHLLLTALFSLPLLLLLLPAVCCDARCLAGRAA